MKLHTPKCPTCGRSAIGASDWIPGCARFDGDPADGPVDYSGETKLFWDGQYNAIELAGRGDSELHILPNVPERDQMQVQCTNGHEWITQVEEEQ